MQGDLFGFDGTGWRPVKRGFDVRLFGAVGNGTTPDTAAFQRAVDAAVAANGTLIIPDAPTQWVLDNTVTIAAASGGAQAYMDIDARGNFNSIKWTGGNGKSIFKSYGWKQSRIRGVRIRLAGTVSNVIAFDVDHDATRTSTSHLTFNDCHVTSDAVGVKTSCMGWRVGHSLGVEFSYLRWDTCSADFQSGTDVTCTGWGLEENNGLICTWVNSSVTGCSEGWTSNQTAGAGMTAGSSAWTFIGCGATGNITDFVFGAWNLTIIGGRFELGKQFLSSLTGSNGRTMSVRDVEISGYTPNEAGGQRVFNFSNGTLILDGVILNRFGGAAHTSSTVQMSNAFVPSNLIVRGGNFYAADPFFTNFNAAGGIVQIERAMITDSAGLVTGRFKEYTVPRIVTALTYSATIATNAQLGERFTIAATNGTAFTISTPTLPATGQTLTYDIKNSSGGAHGVITWGAGFLNGGAGTVGTGAFAGIANGKRRTISFYYDGTNWIELYRTADQ